MKPVAIFGAGGFGKEVFTLLHDVIDEEKKPWKFIGFFDDHDYSEKLGDFYLGDLTKLNTWKEPILIVIALGWSHIRKSVFDRINNPQIDYPTLISPKCILGYPSRIRAGRGVIIMAGANLTIDVKLGDFVVVNLNATLGHDAMLGNYCSVMPSVNISGNVKMGDEVFIGSGATILQNIHIGDKSIIGAGAVVTRDVETNTTVVGIPAKVIKRR